MMFEHAVDPEPLDAVVLDVHLEQALEIDRELADRFENTLFLGDSERIAPAA
jgi:hypothetical protein